MEKRLDQNEQKALAGKYAIDKLIEQKSIKYDQVICR